LAQRTATGLGERANQLFQVIASSRASGGGWRERRAMAADAHELLELAQALRGYLDRASHFAPDGDGSGGLDLLKSAWAHWDAAAAAWGVDRAETISCT
jgi:hypothetical protein